MSTTTQNLYVAYFGRPAGGTADERVARRLREEGVDVPIFTGGGRMGYIEVPALAPPVYALPRSQGPSAKDARRAQIKRNGGKR